MKEIDKLAKEFELTKTSIRIPKIAWNLVLEKSNKDGVPLAQYFYSFIGQFLPEDLKGFIGEDTYKNLINEIKESLKSLFEKDVTAFSGIFSSGFLVDDFKKNVEFLYKLLSDKPTTVGRNNLLNGLCLRDEYIKQIKRDVLDDELKQYYRESVDKVFLNIDNLFK